MRHRRSPRRTPASRSFLLPAIVLLFVTSGVDVAWGCLVGRVVEPGVAAQLWRKRLEAQLAILYSGDVEERLDAAEAANSLLGRQRDEMEDPSDPGVDEILLALGNRIALEPDDFVSWTVVDALLWRDGEDSIRALFRDAIRASSPNVRAHAVHWFQTHEDHATMPILEDLWESGLPGWARADLMGALAHQGSKRHLGEFLGLAAGDDAAIAIAAIEALDELDDERAVSALAAVARTGKPAAVRAAALGALSSWPESDEAFRTVLTISRNGGKERAEAISMLGGFRRPEGDDRLLEVLWTEDDPDARLDAARSLEDRDLPGVTEALLDLLDDDREWFLSEVFTVLHNRNDPAALPRLEAMQPQGEWLRRELEQLVAYLSQEESDADRTIMVRTSCGSSIVDPDDPGTWHIDAPRGTHSVRCDRGPGIAGQSWAMPRMPDGTLVTIEDRFERDGATWALIGWDEDCWVPMTALGPGAASRPGPPDRLEPEIDLPSGALSSKAGRHLLESGVIEVLDSEGDAVGVAFHLEPGGPSLMALVEELSRHARGAVEDQLLDVADLAEDLADEMEDEAAPDESD